MKQSILGLLSTAVLISLCGVPLRAADAAGTNVAVIDISYIFAHHERFKQEIEGMKKDVEALEAQLRKRAGDIEKKREEMRQYKAGSPEYRQLEETVTKMQADGQAEAQIRRNEFLDREAKIYYDVYREIIQAVEQFATQHSIRLVVRFNSEPVDPQNRRSVLEAVNRGIVYQDRLNITVPILNQLNRVAARPGGAAPK